MLKLLLLQFIHILLFTLFINPLINLFSHNNKTNFLKQLMSKRYFINNLDTKFGQALFKQLVKQPPEEPIHLCTMRDPILQKPKGIKKILKREKPKLSRKKMLQQADVYIYNIHQTDISDINFGISIFEKPIEQQKVFILISDIMSWSNTPRKIKIEKKPEVQQEIKDQIKQEAQQVPPPEENKSKQGSVKSEPAQQVEKQILPEVQVKPIEYTYYEDKDFQSRVPLQKYQYIKQIEDKVLKLKRQNVKVYVICPGIFYGQGQTVFYNLFKSAWLQIPKQSHYIGEGQNLIPTIHIADLAKFVIKVSESPPEENPYLLAFDDSKDRRQKVIIQSISKGVGSGTIKSVQNSQLIQQRDKFVLDIDIKPSKLLVGTAQEPVDFEWTCRFGLPQSTKKVLQEFCQKQKLRPLNIITMIPQNQRKSKESRYPSILKELQSQYRTPVLKIQQILLYAKNNAPEQLRNDLLEENLNILNYLSQKKSIPLNQTLKVLYRVVKWRLSQNDCACRGYILDNYPRFEEEAKYIFLPQSISKLKRKVKKIVQKPHIQQHKSQQQIGQNKEAQQQQPQQVPQDEKQQQQIQEQEGKPKKEKFYPESIIKIKNLENKQLYFNEVASYFSLNGIQQLIYDINNKHQLEIFQSLRAYIERNGRPNNYLISEEKLHQDHKAYYQQISKKKQQQKKKSDQQLVKQKADARKKRQKLAQEIYESVKFQGQFEIKKMPFRNYLMEFVVPILNQGLLEVSNIIPNDPVELLAQYLYQKSYDV